jgi:hypothetical protein
MALFKNCLIVQVVEGCVGIGITVSVGHTMAELEQATMFFIK